MVRGADGHHGVVRIGKMQNERIFDSVVMLRKMPRKEFALSDEPFGGGVIRKIFHLIFFLFCDSVCDFEAYYSKKGEKL